MLTTYPLTQLDSATMADFGDLHAMGLHFCDYTASSRGLTTANWGNRTIRTATRRRHANSQLLVLPNPHRSRSGGRRRDRRAWLRCPWAAAGPGRASRRRAERSSRRGRRAGGPPPTGTQSSPAQQGTPSSPAQQGTPSSPAQQATGCAKGGGYRSTRPLVGSLSHCLVEAQAE